MQPAWVTVGYGHRAPNTPVHAAVAIGYDSTQLPLVRVIAKALRTQLRSPTIAIFDDTIQICFATSPVTSECKSFASQLSVLPEVLDKVVGFNITSFADVFPDDDAFKIFERCYKQDHTILLVLMEVANVGLEGGEGIAFDMFSVTDLKTEFQWLI